jgi:hypothetical protein
MRLPLSFRTAKDLRGKAELLPIGPKWRGKPLVTAHPTKLPVRLYYRDPLECLQSLFHSPLVADHIDMTPFRLFTSAEKLMRVYTEWLSGDTSWEMQVISTFKSSVTWTPYLHNVG